MLCGRVLTWCSVRLSSAERGVFGSPTFFVRDQMFFGNDRRLYSPAIHAPDRYSESERPSKRSPGLRFSDFRYSMTISR